MPTLTLSRLVVTCSPSLYTFLARCPLVCGLTRAPAPLSTSSRRLRLVLDLVQTGELRRLSGSTVASELMLSSTTRRSRSVSFGAEGSAKTSLIDCFLRREHLARQSEILSAHWSDCLTDVTRTGDVRLHDPSQGVRCRGDHSCIRQVLATSQGCSYRIARHHDQGAHVSCSGSSCRSHANPSPFSQHRAFEEQLALRGS